jgi:hypothetical protein
VGNQTDSLPLTLLVLNKKDLIKLVEIAKKLEVSICLLLSMLACNFGSFRTCKESSVEVAERYKYLKTNCTSRHCLHRITSRPICASRISK